MIRLVSASSERCFSSTGGPTETVTSGGSATLSTLGRRLDRGHTRSVPHSPTGMTGALVSCASRAAPQRPLSTGSKNAGPLGIVPWGMIPTTSPPSIADTAACNGSLEPLARSTRMPPMARLSWPTSGTSNTSFLPRKRTVRPLRATTRAIAPGSK